MYCAPCFIVNGNMVLSTQIIQLKWFDLITLFVRMVCVFHSLTLFLFTCSLSLSQFIVVVIYSVALSFYGKWWYLAMDMCIFRFFLPCIHFIHTVEENLCKKKTSVKVMFTLYQVDEWLRAFQTGDKRFQ